MSFLPIEIEAFLYNMVLPLIAGLLITKLTKIPKEKFDVLIKINIALFIPFAIFTSFWAVSFTTDMIFLPIIGFIIPCIGALFGFIFSRKLQKDGKEKGSYIVSAMLSNRKTVGGLSAYLLFGEIGYIYMNVIMLLNTITTFGIAHPIGIHFGRNSAMKKKASFKSVVFRISNISILALLLGILLNVLNITRPLFMQNAVDKLIKISAWLALLPVGASINISGIKKNYKDLPSILLIKFAILPAIAYAISFLFLKDTTALITVVILAMSPVAIHAVAITKMYSLDEDFTMSAFLLTNIIYLIIMFPAIIFFVKVLNA